MYPATVFHRAIRDAARTGKLSLIASLAIVGFRPLSLGLSTILGNAFGSSHTTDGKALPAAHD
jgi:hypothetical protein